MTDTEVTMPVEASGDALAKREKKPANQNKNKGVNICEKMDALPVKPQMFICLDCDRYSLTKEHICQPLGRPIFRGSQYL